MNFLIIGLGNFGAALAVKLTQFGHEVIGVDINMTKVEMLKNDITHTICADCSDVHSAKDLPVKDADAVVICIGEHEGNSLMATALMKQLNAKRIISRAVSITQETVLNTMGIEEIVHPEQDSAEKLAKSITTNRLIDTFDLSDDYSIVKADVPERYNGKALNETDIRSDYNITILAVISKTYKRSVLGIKRLVHEVKAIAKADTVLKEGEVIVIFGNVKDIKRFLD